MSADKWTVCPKCKLDAEKKKELATLKVKVAYGKVPVETYLELARLADKEIDLENDMREDYQQGTDEYGTYWINYSCYCKKCNFSWKYKSSMSVFETPSA